MNYTSIQIGGKECKLSRMAFGCIPISRMGFSNAVDLLEKAYKSGINFFDTARAYRDSEKKLSHILSKYSDTYVSTKSISRGGLGVKYDISKSRKLLNLDFIPVYSLHNIASENEFNKAFSHKGGVDVLNKAKSDNIIGLVGISTHLIDIAKRGILSGRIDIIHFPYNLFDDWAEKEIFSLARENKVRILTVKPIGFGYFSSPSRCVAHVYSNLALDFVSVGIGSEAQLTQNIADLGLGRLSEEEKEKIIFASEERKGFRLCRLCDNCIECSNGVDIRRIMEIYNLFERYHMLDWGRSEYKKLKLNATCCFTCSGCGSCKNKIDIKNKLTHIHSRLNPSLAGLRSLKRKIKKLITRREH